MARTFRRPVMAATVGVLLLSGLAACGDDSSEADGLGDIELVFDNALTICTDMPYVPFEYKSNGMNTGFDLELAGEIAAELDVDLDVLDVSFDDIVSGALLNAGTCDLAVSAISISGERARVVDFSSPYFDAKQGLVAGKDSSITDMGDLSGRTVGVQSSTTGQTYLSDHTQNAEIRKFGDASQLEAALLSGEVEAIVMDAPAAGRLVRKRKDFAVVNEYDTGEQYGMAVKKDGNLPLLRRVNSVLADLQENGTYDELYDKYFS